MSVDRAAGAILVLIGLFTLSASRAFPLGTLHHPGPSFVPAALSIILIFFGVAMAAGDRTRAFPKIHWSELRHVVAILAIGAFSAWGLERLGYRLTMGIVVAFLLFGLERRRLFPGTLVTVGMAWGSFYVFDTLLKVPLPRGPFGI